MREDLQELNLRIEGVAGLALTCRADGNKVAAGQYAREIAGYIVANGLRGTSDPFLVYRICIKILRDRDDSLATDLEVKAARLRADIADRIGNLSTRKRFLEVEDVRGEL